MENTVVKGYKVFHSDWKCNNKQYTCPGKFEEDVTHSSCERGMHFCKRAVDCFNYYLFKPENKVAEVVAYGTIVEDGDKCYTDKLEIIREIPWQELLEIVNTGRGCTGRCNSGNWNSGEYNSGKYNSGNWNTGRCNSGNWNSGNWNSGDYNSGKYNSGNWNSGDYNSGKYNSGKYNSGNCNSGDWNKTNFSNGCFNTIEPKIYLFDKPSELTYRDWMDSEAYNILSHIPSDVLEYIFIKDMTDEEKAAHPEAETTGGYLKHIRRSEDVSEWWKHLDSEEKDIILSLPNFDADIFKEITGIDVNEA